MEFLTDILDPDDLGVPIEEADEYGVDLNVSGLCANDKDVANLFGGVRVAPGAVRRFDREQKLWRVMTMPSHFKYEGRRVVSSP